MLDSSVTEVRRDKLAKKLVKISTFFDKCKRNVLSNRLLLLLHIFDATTIILTNLNVLPFLPSQGGEKTLQRMHHATYSFKDIFQDFFTVKQAS